MQTDALSVLVSTPEVEKLHSKLAFLDHTEPLAAFNAGMAPSAVNPDVLRRYLQGVTHARRKLLFFYPQHEERLEKELTLLSKLKEP